MSGIKGKVREQKDFTKKVGIVEANVVAINPTLKEYEDVLGLPVKEDQEEFDYTGVSREGNSSVRVDVWLKEVAKTSEDGESEPNLFKATFFLEDKVRVNKDGDKTQYINNIGNCVWTDEEENLFSWFVKRPHREAMNGEDEFYGFLRTWLGGLDYRDEDTELELNWKNLMKGNLDALKEQIGGSYATSFGALATVVTKTKENEDGEEINVQYQGIYNKAFIPNYALKHFKSKDYNDALVQSTIESKSMKDMKVHEKFVANVIGEYGCKDYFQLGMVKDYDPEENLASQEEAMLEGAEEETSSEY